LPYHHKQTVGLSGSLELSWALTRAAGDEVHRRNTHSHQSSSTWQLAQQQMRSKAAGGDARLTCGEEDDFIPQMLAGGANEVSQVLLVAPTEAILILHLQRE
jgi:hypothetical protein